MPQANATKNSNPLVAIADTASPEVVDGLVSLLSNRYGPSVDVCGYSGINAGRHLLAKHYLKRGGKKPQIVILNVGNNCGSRAPGVETARAIHALDPTVPTVLTSTNDRYLINAVFALLNEGDTYFVPKSDLPELISHGKLDQVLGFHPIPFSPSG